MKNNTFNFAASEINAMLVESVTFRNHIATLFGNGADDELRNNLIGFVREIGKDNKIGMIKRLKDRIALDSTYDRLFETGDIVIGDPSQWNPKGRSLGLAVAKRWVEKYCYELNPSTV